MGGGAGGNFGNTLGSLLDKISDGLAIASLIPGLDTFADLASVPIDLARGDYVSAGLSALGAVPFVGEVADSAKLAKMADKVGDAAKLADKSASIAKRSPIKIPKKAVTQVQSKKGYSQIKYTWESGKYKYLSRWHTQTPNAPKDQGTSWVVERRIPGVGHGKNVSKPQEEILIGKNKWISKKEWNEAITARKTGKATKRQKEILDNGHWKDR